jgi:hypothetical protein
MPKFKEGVHTHGGLPIAIIHGMDVPYLAGVSEDGNTLYVDGSVPCEDTIEGVLLNLILRLASHEYGEWLKMIHEGMAYLPAHVRGGDRLENEDVSRFGVSPRAYNDYLTPLIASCLARFKAGDMKNIPVDLFRGPYAYCKQEHLLPPAPPILKAVRMGSNGIEAGDEVYFKGRDGGMHAGEVTHCGRDGFICHADDETHRVLHENYVGHRRRKARQASVIDHGEDGLLAELEDGKHLFIRHGDLEKAQGAGRTLLLLKGGPIKNKPGLVLRDTAGKDGKRTRRWMLATGKPVKAAKESAAAEEPGLPGPLAQAKVGERVRAGDVRGRIVARGRDGVQVEGPDGKIHKLPNNAQGARIWKPEAHGGGKVEPAEIAKFPALVGRKSGRKHQRGVKDEDSAYAQAETAREQFEHLLTMPDGLAQRLGAKIFKSDAAGAKDYLEEHPDKAALLIASPKGRVRAREKAEKKGWHSVADLLRASIVVSKLEQVPKALQAIRDSGLKIAELRNRFHAPLASGYRDILMRMELPNGHLAELQVHVAPMFLAKEAYGGHDHYERTRGLDEGKVDKGIKLTDDEAKTLKHHDQAMADLYGRAWKIASGSV